MRTAITSANTKLKLFLQIVIFLPNCSISVGAVTNPTIVRVVMNAATVIVDAPCA